MRYNQILCSIGIVLSFHVGALTAGTGDQSTVPVLQDSEYRENISPSWWDAVRRDIGRAEYAITWQERTYVADVVAAYHAPNRAHNLRTYFTPEGIRVVPRTGDPATWQWGLTLVAYGYAGNLKAPAVATLVNSDNRFEYQRDGFTEWYLNDPRGLEQGFTFMTPPASRRNPSPLQIRLGIVGSLLPALDAGGGIVHFQTPDGVAVLEYGGLYAEDAEGRPLRAELTLTGSQLSIEVDDTGAVYPITIDPLATTSSWTAESNQNEAAFGFSVATAGDVNADGYSDVLVGAPNYDGGDADEGRVYLYEGSASGLGTVAWSTEGEQVGANYGNSVATAGDVNGDGYSDVIIGAPQYDNGEAGEGAAFVFHGSASGLGTTHDWFAEFDYPGRNLGDAVSTAGDVNGDGYSDVIIEARANDQAYVWHGSSSGLGADGTPSNADWYANISASGTGGSVGTAGDVNGDGYADVIMGIHNYSNGESWEGGAFIWFGSSTGLGATGSESNADWSAESDQVDAYLGRAVSTAGDINGDGYADVIVGANGYDNGNTNEGAVFLYYGSSTGPSSVPDWSYEGGADYAYLGVSVAAAGDINGDGYADVAAGAATFTMHVPTLNSEGSAYVFFGSAGGLGASASWSRSGGQAEAAYGHAVATAGDVDGDGYSDFLVGSPGYSFFPANEGRVFLYSGSPAGLSLSDAWFYSLSQDDSGFGESVATAGDVNGDGYADVIIGAADFDSGISGEGGAWVFYGSAAGLDAPADWTATSNQADAGFGCSVGSAGDVNNDGYDDVIVGANNYDDTLTDEGAAFVWLGSASGLGPAGNPANADWSAFGGQATARFGFCVATAGDVDGDGYQDIIVGAPFYHDGELNEGRVEVYLGSSSGLQTTAHWSAQSDDPSARMGISVAAAGDVDGDGYSDIIVGAPWYTNGSTDEGAVFVWRGSSWGLGADGTPSNSDWAAESNQAGALFGISVGSAGDVDGDGFADVIVGASHYQDAYSQEGAAFAWYGSALGLGAGGTPLNADWDVYGGQDGANLGNAAGTAGDVNGDGYADVIVGAFQYDGVSFPSTATDGGRVLSYSGSPTGLATTADWTRDAVGLLAISEMRLGVSAASAGDVNGDGYADVIVGADEDQGANSYTNEGSAWVFYGGSRDAGLIFYWGGGPNLQPRQVRADDSGPIAHLGMSDSETMFRIATEGRTPYGRAQVKLEWEVERLGVSFTGSSTSESTDWTDTGVTGTTINELVTGLSAATVYHWRVRMLYHPAVVPFQQFSRWYTMPWNGWQEADLRTPGVVSGTGYDMPSPSGLCEVFPNPFNAAVTIRFHVGPSEPVTLVIYDITGRLVKTLIDDERFEPGYSSMVWRGDDKNGRLVSSGLYIFKYTSGSNAVLGKLMLLK